MSEPAAIAASPLRTTATALAACTTVTLALFATPAATSHEQLADAGLVSCATDQVCAAVLAAPACARTVFCLDVLDWVGSSQRGDESEHDEATPVRRRTLGLTPRYMMREFPDQPRAPRWLPRHVAHDLPPHSIER